MRAGLLKNRIKIITATVTTNIYGEETTEWTEKYSTRARLVHLNGNRVDYNGEIFYTSVKTLEIRDYVPVDEFDRIVWNNITYQILDILPDESNRKKIITITKLND